MQLIDLILYRAYAELRRDIASAYLGMLWWVLEPLMYMAAFYLVFAVGIRSGGENFTSFLLCGLASWKWFASTLNQSAACVLAHRGLIQQVYLPKVILPLIPVVVNLVKFVVILALLLAFLWVMGFSPSLNWLYLLPVIAVELVFILGCSLLVAAIVPFVMDLRVLITNGLTMMMFLSGIFFSVSDFPEEVRGYFYLNPMVPVIESFRVVLLDGGVPDWRALGAVLLFSLLSGLLGFSVFRRFDRHYAKVMS